MTSRTNFLDATPDMVAPAMSRRDALIRFTGATLATALAAAPALAADEHAGHGEMDHSAHMHNGPAKHQALIDAALVCVNRGEVCSAHCLELIAMGDTSIAACLKSVSGMLPMCAALSRLAALDSPRLKELAKVCLDVCEDCEKECKKHADKHAACKACMESCAECAKACKKLLDA